VAIRSLPKLLKCDLKEWLRNPRAMSLAAIACSCNSSAWISLSPFEKTYRSNARFKYQNFIQGKSIKYNKRKTIQKTSGRLDCC